MEDIRIGRKSSPTRRYWYLGVDDPNPSTVLMPDPNRISITIDILSAVDVIFYVGEFDNTSTIFRTAGTSVFWKTFRIEDYGKLLWEPWVLFAPGGAAQASVVSLHLGDQ